MKDRDTFVLDYYKRLAEYFKAVKRGNYRRARALNESLARDFARLPWRHRWWLRRKMWRLHFGMRIARICKPLGLLIIP